MTWVLVAGAAWLVIALLSAILIGRSIHLADSRAATDARPDRSMPDLATVDSPSVLSIPRIRPLTSTVAQGDAHPPAPPTTHDTPTLPGIPVARPPAPGAKGAKDEEPARLRQTGLG